MGPDISTYLAQFVSCDYDIIESRINACKTWNECFKCSQLNFLGDGRAHNSTDHIGKNGIFVISDFFLLQNALRSLLAQFAWDPFEPEIIPTWKKQCWKFLKMKNLRLLFYLFFCADYRVANKPPRNFSKLRSSGQV